MDCFSLRVIACHWLFNNVLHCVISMNLEHGKEIEIPPSPYNLMEKNLCVVLLVMFVFNIDILFYFNILAYFLSF